MARYYYFHLLQFLLTSNIAIDAFQTNINPIHTLLLCRHGDSIWNGGQPGTKETFTGWTDVPLSPKGIIEASNTGKEVSAYSYGIDACFTSILGRAKVTAHHCLWAFGEQPYFTHPQKYISDYRLNERHYGALQGYVKNEVENGSLGYAPDLVRQWRRNWHAIPPMLDDDDPRRILEVKKYSNFCGGADNVPKGESLQMVANNRIKPFLNNVLNPIMEEAVERRKQIRTEDRISHTSSHDDHDSDYESQGGTGLVIAHANSLRALIGVICQVENDEIALKKLEAMKIQTGVPLVMKYRKSICREYYEACSISGLDDNIWNKPDLPVWPLSCIPKKSLHATNLVSQRMGSQSNSNDNKKQIRIDVI